MLKPPILPAPAGEWDRIAFAGPMCSGKTTLATRLALHEGYTKVAFAGLLKETAAKLYGVVNKDNEGRKLLQELADDLKKWDRNLFTTHLLFTVEDYINNGRTRFVLDDLRFVAEEYALRTAGFKIILVTCNEDMRQARIRQLYPDTDPARFEHPSETGWKSMYPDAVVRSESYSDAIEIASRIRHGILASA